MKECLKCGAAVPDDGVFCPVCGSRADGYGKDSVARIFAASTGVTLSG